MLVDPGASVIDSAISMDNGFLSKAPADQRLFLLRTHCRA
jgi:hypothetical protein